MGRTQNRWYWLLRTNLYRSSWPARRCPMRGSTCTHRRRGVPPSSTNRRNSPAPSASHSNLRTAAAAPLPSRLKRPARSDLVAWARRLGKEKEELRSSCSLASSSTARCLQSRSAPSHSCAARFSFLRHRSSDASLICHLRDVSSAASSLICAISSLSTCCPFEFSPSAAGFAAASCSPLSRPQMTSFRVSSAIAELTISAIT